MSDSAGQVVRSLGEAGILCSAKLAIAQRPRICRIEAINPVKNAELICFFSRTHTLKSKTKKHKGKRGKLAGHFPTAFPVLRAEGAGRKSLCWKHVVDRRVGGEDEGRVILQRIQLAGLRFSH